MTVTIKHFDKIGGTPIIGYAVKAWKELLELNFVDDRVPLIYWDDRAVVAYDYNTNVVGFISYGKTDWLNEASIHIGYVEKAFRRQGVYRDLWNALISKSRELGLTRISSSTSVRNIDMRKVAESLGRYERSVNIYFDIPLEENKI